MKHLRLILFFFMLVGCSTYPFMQVTEESHEIPTNTFLPEPIATTVYPQHYFTPTLPPTSFTVQTHCPQVTLASNELPSLTGTLVFSGDNVLIRNKILSPESGNNAAISFWNPQFDVIRSYQLPEDHIYYYYSESPDKERLAFTEGKTLDISSDVIILNGQGREYKRIVFPDDWTFFDWLDNENLLFRQFRNQFRTTRQNIDLVAINLLDGEQQVLSSNFPDIFLRDELVLWGAITIFDPTISLVLYPEQENDGRIVSVLWNLKKSEELARFDGGSWPRWSPNGNQLLLISDNERVLHETHDEIFIINSLGDITRATYFTEYYNNTRIDLPVWSPNNRYIAFWLSTSLPSESAKLAVLDIETLNVDLFCNEINPFPSRFGDYLHLGYANNQINSVRPIWSPDSNYLLIEDYKGSSNTFLFDLQNRTIIKIADNVRPVGWLK
jgi:hypothetical protein